MLRCRYLWLFELRKYAIEPLLVAKNNNQRQTADTQSYGSCIELIGCEGYINTYTKEN
jgi:hypothetical protein